MKCLIQGRATCVPVTALHILQCEHECLVLSGQASVLTIHEFSTKAVVLQQKVFASQSIHGISSKHNKKGATSRHVFNLVVWGGASAISVILTLEHAEVKGRTPTLSIVVGNVVVFGDWILWAGQFLVQGVERVFLLTAHNVVYDIDALPGFQNNDTNTSQPLAIQGPKTFLYSADAILADNDCVLIASGTVFGEVLVWRCSRGSHNTKWVTYLDHVFLGHQGSIFGVRLSEAYDIEGLPRRLLASCSDDRTIRLWDISKQADSSNSYPKQRAESESTGFGPASVDDRRLQLTWSWGHTSRIWSAEFLSRKFVANGIRLVSRGEDAACLLWKIDEKPAVLSTNVRLEGIGGDKYHSGKNAWSLAQTHVDGRLSIFTGGGDGQIVSREVNAANGLTHLAWSFAQTFKSIINTLASNLHSEALEHPANITGAKAMKDYIIASQGDVLATSDNGILLRGHLKDQQTIDWEILHINRSNLPLVLCSAARSEKAYFADACGRLYSYDLNSKQILEIFDFGVAISRLHMISSNPMGGHGICLLATPISGDVLRLLWIDQRHNAADPQESTLYLPDTFVVTSALYDRASELLVLGSRSGALAIYPQVKISDILVTGCICVRHLHGSDSITSIQALGPGDYDRAEDSFEAIHLLTTGRDGAYAIHRLVKNSPAEQSTSLTCETVHLATPGFGPNIEGAYLAEAGRGSPDLMLYGFDSKNFVVWNETTQMNLFSVDCGGAHRSWTYIPQLSGDGSSFGTFVWTKAGSFNLRRCPIKADNVIRTGGHGREIKALAVCSNSFGNVETQPIVATGAEDTTIRLFTLAKAPEDSMKNPTFRCVATLKNHTTGLQHLKFTSSGRSLLSGAGSGEFIIWRLRNKMPCVSFGVMVQDTMARDEEDTDSRIMSFDILEDIHLSGDIGSNSSLLILMAYSSGKAKLVEYLAGPAPRQGQFNVLQIIACESYCLTQARIFNNEMFLTPTALMAGTNGSITVATCNGREPSRAEHSTITTHRIHQSSVAALEMVRLQPGLWLLASGGDDNAVGLTLMFESTDSPVIYDFRTLLIPRAHAAAVTALSLIKCASATKDHQIILATAANDQRIKIWRVTVAADIAAKPLVATDDMCGDMMNELRVTKLGQQWTSIADVSAMEVIPSDPTGRSLESARKTPPGFRVMVVGVGMEVLDVKFEDEQ